MSQCRSCEADIEWTKTATGKNTPLNLDGTPHWSTCPHAREWKRPAPVAADPEIPPIGFSRYRDGGTGGRR